MSFEERIDLWEHAFICRAEPDGSGRYLARLDYAGGPAFIADELPADELGHGSAEEALRQAQLQAMRWVHDRTGDAQGQF